MEWELFKISTTCPREGPKGCRVAGFGAPGGAVLILDVMSSRFPLVPTYAVSNNKERLSPFCTLRLHVCEYWLRSLGGRYRWSPVGAEGEGTTSTGSMLLSVYVGAVNGNSVMLLRK